MKEKLSIYEKLSKIQEELKAPKGQYNEFGKYNYRSCEDIFEAVKPLLQKYKLILTTTDEMISIGDRYYIKAIAKLVDVDMPYEEFDECKAINCITNVGWAREEEIKKGMDGSQITGASSSYARKYALNGLFLIDDNKDSDTTNVGEETIKEPTKEDAEKFVVSFGKYKGKLLSEVIKDSWYKNYLLSGNDEYIKKCIELLTGEKLLTEEEQNERLVLLAQMQDLVDKTNVNYEDILTHYDVKSNSELSILQLKEINDDLEARL